MYDAYDQVRRIMEGYRQTIDEPVRRAMEAHRRSVDDQVSSAIRAARLLPDQWAHQLTYPAGLLDAAAQWDKYLPARNLFDQFQIDKSLAADALRNAYRPEALAHVDEMLARIQADTAGLRNQLGESASARFLEASRLSTENLAAVKERFLETSRLSVANLAALNDSYSQLEVLQRSWAAQSADLASRLHADLASRLDQLKPLLSAQSNWARTVRFPSLIEHAHLFADQATTLFKEISALHSSWKLSPGDLEGVDREEQAEQAIALANERLAAAFIEKSPAATMQRLGEVLVYLKSGVLRLAPYARKFLIELLIHLIASFILHYSVEVYKEVRAPETPRVSKEVRREVRKIQREGIPLPRDLRVVIATELMVRRGPGLSNPVVGRLYAGDLVTWIRTRSRSWSLVEFQDEDGEVVLRGWVFSRYVRSPRGCGYWTCQSR